MTSFSDDEPLPRRLKRPPVELPGKDGATPNLSDYLRLCIFYQADSPNRAHEPLLGSRFEVISTLGFVVVAQQALAGKAEKMDGTEIMDSPSHFRAASQPQAGDLICRCR
jgi:hypothetical protein